MKIFPRPEIPASCKIHPTAIIYPNARIGENVTVRAYSVIGSPPENDGHWDDVGMGVEIGDNVIISEHVSVHSGVTRVTKIGSGTKIMTKAHLGHDVVVGENVTISCSVLVGGHSEIGKGCNLGLGAVVHQHGKLGSYSMIGANSFVPKKKRVVPGNIYVGSPIEFLKNNTIGLQRQGVTQEELQKEIELYYEATKDWVDL